MMFRQKSAKHKRMNSESLLAFFRAIHEATILDRSLQLVLGM